jgi:hypothetical protein
MARCLISAFSKSFFGHGAVPPGWANPGLIRQQPAEPRGELALIAGTANRWQPGALAP